MKPRVLFVIFSMSVAVTAFGGIGEDEKQIEARYGKAGKDLGSRGDVHEVGYIANGFMILVDYVNGTSRREGFTKPDTSVLTDQNVKDILEMSTPQGTTWQQGESKGGDKTWNRSDQKAVAVLPAMGKFLFVQDVTFVQPADEKK